MRYRFNALRDYNYVGIVVAVLTAFITLTVLGAKTPNPDFRIMMAPLCGVFWILALVMLQMRQYTEIDLDRQVIRVGRGLYPVIRWKEREFQGPLSVVFGASRGRNSILYKADLLYNGDQKASLAVGTGETGMKTFVEFAEHIGATLQPGPGLEQYAPKWLKKKLPELGEG